LDEWRGKIMLFYATLLITSLMVTLIILALYNLVVHFAKRNASSKARRDPAAHLGDYKHGRRLHPASSQWGRPNSHAEPAELARTHPAQPVGAIPWGWPGNEVGHHDAVHHRSSTNGAGMLDNHLVRHTLAKNQTVDDWKHNIARPVRDDRRSLAGKAYKPKVSSLAEFKEQKISEQSG
jgi:hypothetical protein